ncbi:MAG: hypothetical protein WCT99_02775 [Bacteroidota bacterium]|jgi:hypothetical protein
MKTIKQLISFLLIVVFAFGIVNAKEAKDKANKTGQSSGLKKTAIQEWKFFDVNTLQATINSAGPYCDYLKTQSSGLFWPKGGTKTSVYTAGMWVIGMHRPTSSLRTAVQDYQSEFQPGPINGIFNTTTNSSSVAADPTDKRYHIYKVSRKDSLGGNPDYDNWPVDLGAPYIDVDASGTWTPGVDKPKLWGDQQLWCVYNDANIGNHSKTGVTNPMGIEIQTTYFGFDQPGALGNIMFMRWKIINKSDADYDSVFISMWADTDLGDANDDVAACDTIRKLGYIYNGDNNDAGANGYGDKPPAGGFVFFQGPRVNGAATDTALFEGNKRGGFKNLPASSHAVYVNSGTWSDPPLGDTKFAEQAYNYQNGLIGTTGQPFIDPQTNLPSKFVFPGDPVTNTGWTQAASGINPDDMRSMISSGPFTLAKGDTQEIVGGYVIAQGADRLGSITVLRRFVDVAQESFNVNFALASPPPAPTVTVGELPNKVILNWGESKNHQSTESYHYTGTAKDYRFEGYNIYQISDKGTSPTIKRIATFDSVDNVKLVTDVSIDPASGLNLPTVTAFGEDKGVKRSFVIDKDYIKGDNLINGKEYYFAVTSYAYNFDPNGVASGIPQILENSKTIITVVPRQLAAGDRLGGNVGQQILTNRAVNGDDAIVTNIVNPRELNGALYELTFNGTPDAVTSWNIKRKNVGPDTVLLTGISKLTTAGAGPIVGGIQFELTNPVAGPRRDNQSPQGYTYTPAGNLWFSDQSGLKFDAFKINDTSNANSGGIAYPTKNNAYSKGTKVKPYEVKKIEIRFSDTQTQKAYRYLDNVKPFLYSAKDPSFVPYILTKGNGFQYQDFVDVPFTVWEVDSLDGSVAPRQLNAGFLETNDSLYHKNGTFFGLGKVDGKWMPLASPSGGSEPIFIFASDYSDTVLTKYTTTPGASTNIDLKASMDSVDVMYAVGLRRNDTVKTFANGDKFTIIPNYPFTTSTTYLISTPKNISNNVDLIKSDIDRINVVPNPYFANNLAETNVYQRFVTFTNLPPVATIRIFSLTGELLKTVRHASVTSANQLYTSGYERWDLRNEAGLPVASGMYIALIEIPNVGNRTLKLAIVQPEERPTR